MLTNDGLKPDTVRHTRYKLQELAREVDIFNPEAVKNYVATAISLKTKKEKNTVENNKITLLCPQTPPKQCCTPLEK